MKTDAKQVEINQAFPILKWVGGKARLLPEIMSRLPRDWGCYHEPFVGGGALFFALARVFGKLSGGAAISDANPDVINVYRALVEDVGGVVKALKGLQRRHRKHPMDAFEAIRGERNRPKTRARNAFASVAWAARTLYLNRACFNGLWRVNRAGEFNVPLGAYDHASLDLVREDALRAAARALSGRSICLSNFQVSLGDVAPGDFVYVDPPYVPASATSSFTSYTTDGFGDGHQQVLADMMIDLAKRGAHVMISNSDTPVTRALYTHDALAIDSVGAPRSINSKGGRRGKVGELIVTSRHSRG